MSAQIVVELPEERKLYFGDDPERLVEASARGKLAAMTTDTFKSALSSLGELVKILEDSVGNLPKLPNKVEMEFGASLKGDCNLWIVAGEGEADFKVKLSWERKSPATAS